MSWQALFVGLFVMYLSGFYILRSQRDLWEKEFSRKLSEITGIKGYYEKKITQLERKIDDAHKELGGAGGAGGVECIDEGIEYSESRNE